MQQSLLKINAVVETDASEQGFDGSDLKRVALCDDGNTYAIKRTVDHPLIPLIEWVGYHLCRKCSILTPDFSIIYPQDDGAPYFGSRISSYSQIEHSPGNFRIYSYFSGHQNALSAIYLLDAVVINPDRHGRNLFVRNETTPPQLLAFDFAQAWIRTGSPFGTTEALRDSATESWWKTFKKMGCRFDEDTKSLISSIDSNWLEKVIRSSPEEWTSSINIPEVVEFWQSRRDRRIDWAKLWLT